MYLSGVGVDPTLNFFDTLLRRAPSRSANLTIGYYHNLSLGLNLNLTLPSAALGPQASKACELAVIL